MAISRTINFNLPFMPVQIETKASIFNSNSTLFFVSGWLYIWSSSLFLGRKKGWQGRGHNTDLCSNNLFSGEESFAINLCSPICMSVYQGLSYTCCYSLFSVPTDLQSMFERYLKLCFERCLKLFFRYILIS